jgi:sulfite exporter TauE/SafE
MLTVTVLCGVGHVLGSIGLGFLGIALGWAVGSMESIESVRGDWAAWALIGFGLAYGAWGIRQGIRRKAHSHLHVHEDGIAHIHSHAHVTEHSHVHDVPEKISITPWMMFIVFVLGPCEPLIPILMVPASQHSWGGVALVSSVFAVTTIVTMTVMVLVISTGLSFLRVSSLERWAHALAGFSLFACGGAIKWLGL